MLLPSNVYRVHSDAGEGGGELCPPTSQRAASAHNRFLHLSISNARFQWFFSVFHLFRNFVVIPASSDLNANYFLPQHEWDFYIEFKEGENENKLIYTKYIYINAY